MSSKSGASRTKDGSVHTHSVIAAEPRIVAVLADTVNQKSRHFMSLSSLTLNDKEPASDFRIRVDVLRESRSITIG